MAETRVPGPPGGATPPGFDRELDVRGIGAFGIGLTIVMIVLMGVVWLLLGRFRQVQVARDPAPSPLAEANLPTLPPEPRLQASETDDMVLLRRREDDTLNTYGWVDRGAGIGRIPIGRAMAILEKSGLPSSPPGPPPSPAPRPSRQGRKR